MAIKNEIKWFKETFAADVTPALAGTPISLDLVCAIAFQESGELWSQMRQTLPLADVLRLSVGDTLDEPNRSAFPKNKAALLGAPRGDEMFALAHRLLGEMADATGIEIYQSLASRPDKFVHGYGIFQYDLQFFRREPDFFLEQRWKDIDVAIEKLMRELTNAVDQLGFTDRDELTDRESAFVGIVYNAGFRNFKESRELAQGHFDGAHFYGENIDRFIKIAHTIPTPAPGAAPPHAAAPAAPARVAAMPMTHTARSVVAAAKAEFDRFADIDEGDEPLRSRIADYYEAGGGSRDLDPTLNENAWSAAFVSFCVKQAGATARQFKFNLSHSVFVRAAIANGEANVGVFRGHRVGDHAPALGDLIHHNRSGGTLSFDFARDHTGYPSHSCIVVGFEMRNGVRHAVTIGGNEFLAGGTGTVGTKAFPLDTNGFLNQAAIGPKLICVVENLLEAGSAAPDLLLGPYVVQVRTDLKLRGGPGPTFPVIKSLLDGTRLNVLDFDENATGLWALVDLEGDGVKDGFVFATFIEPVTA
ncbi:hypothetical protein OPKNFCMD_5830 [Methylobacterium crusticola]|uniref:DUF2272 domain-containing protein n=1 Tax=Methylobacterium crusticola TaxID=1697972 RepID=A0ABQ4R8C8_9HYPH|nr:DUF2272 domain-containing protein [Methylobacterium crusticola]GJD53059.1 hypothetical protein OPKNFCMD_5830 [Methylobacterium crusticola]